jgi:ribosomal protein S18 acetylase RimI-like enzyme
MLGGTTVLRPTIDRAWLERAAVAEPLAHAFALWDLDRHPDRVRFLSALDGETTLGYLLVWLGHPAAPVVQLHGTEGSWPILVAALPPRPLIAVVPEGAEEVVTAARGPASRYPLIGLAAGPGPGESSPRDAAVRRLGAGDRATLGSWAARQSDPAAAEYPRLDPAVEAVWGAFENGRLIGAVRAAVELPRVWLLAGVYVEPAARGRGVALALVRLALEAGRRAGAAVGLFVREDRPGARSVYERAGFRPALRCVWLDAGAGVEP